MSTVKTEVCHVINTVGEQHTITRGIYRKELDLASSPGLHLEPLPGNEAKLPPRYLLYVLVMEYSPM